MLQQEKKKNHQEMMDYNGKMLKLQEEEQDWEIERSGLLSHISILNVNQREEEEVLEELMSQHLIRNEKQMNESHAEELLVAIDKVYIHAQ